MKIIHCSDLHLDSKMETNLSKEQAKERKDEILITFENMIEFANQNKVEIIIIAGDLFDKKNVSSKAKNIVKNSIISNPQIDFLYLKGNHDEKCFLENQELPKNLKTFNDKWTSYKYNNVTITGIELNSQNSYIYNSLLLEKNCTNIVVMHGQEAQNDIKDKAEIISIKELKNKNIDYLALGHIHKFKQEKLDNRGIYCYSGCLEGRGFDECGEKGFVLLDIENGEIKTDFIKIAKRTILEVKIDITNCSKTNEIETKIKEQISNIEKQNLVKVVLVGEIELETDIDIDYLTKKLQEYFYFIKIYNETKVKIDYTKYKYDASLKGEFIRLVLEQDFTDEQKNEIITTGIKALSGDEL